MIELKIFNSVEAIADYTFNLLKQTAAAAGSAKTGTAALSFGSTYDAIFRRWNELYSAGSSGKGQTDSNPEKLPAFFPADERLVDITQPGSNWGSVRKSFLDNCGTEDDRSRWAADASAYRQMLEGLISDHLPVFDLIFLGIGPDGHTASLFPASCPVSDEASWNEMVLETTAPFTPPDRLTLGPEVIASAKRLVVTVTGAGKADIFNQLMTEIQDIETAKNGSTGKMLPPVRIIARRLELGLKTEIICDEPAAEKLSQATTRYKVGL